MNKIKDLKFTHNFFSHLIFDVKLLQTLVQHIEHMSFNNSYTNSHFYCNKELEARDSVLWGIVSPFEFSLQSLLFN